MMPWNDTCPDLAQASYSANLTWYTCRTKSGQLELIIRGEADLYIYQQLLQTVTYSDNALEPDKGIPARNISVSIKSTTLHNIILLFRLYTVTTLVSCCMHSIFNYLTRHEVCIELHEALVLI